MSDEQPVSEPMSIRPARATAKKIGRSFGFHLREVCSVALGKYDESLWLFGNTSDNVSVAININDFRPYFFLDCPDDLGDVDTWVSLVNDDLRPWEGGPDIVTRCDRVRKVPMIGFVNNEALSYLKLQYTNQSSLWKLRKYFERDVHVGKQPRILQMYHDDWGVESMFLHESGLKMQQWVSCCRSVDVKIRQTSCGLERQSGWGDVSPMDTQTSIAPILCCAIRIRAHCALSSELVPIMPNAGTSGDRILTIAVQIYWMGSLEPACVYVFDDPDESKLLDQFEKVVCCDFDVDCFEFLSDNCDPLEYLALRRPRLKLSKFQKYGSKLLRRKGDSKIYSVCHPGRSKMDAACALKKMLLEPMLEGFDLKNAIFHPDLVRGEPDPILRSYSFIRGSFLGREALREQCVSEVDWLRKLEQNTAMLLGFVEISSASYTQLTTAVMNGQQVRVWKKLISKFYEQNLIANKAQLDRPPLIVKRNIEHSDFPNPPDLPNVPFARRKVISSHQRSKNLVGDVVTLQKQKTKKKPAKNRFQGGYVCEPEVGFYAKSNEATFTFDFMSLYPSIIRGDRICYMRLVYDAKYLTDDRFVKTYIPVNDTECIVMIEGQVSPDGTFQPARTILPQTIEEVCQERNRVKALMKNTTDPFLRASLNAKQLSCKVFQNAVYGFLGVEQNALLACPVLMATVCRIGQNMIKKVRNFMLADHGAYCVYGDTDSVMMQFPHPSELTESTDIFDYYYSLCGRLAVLGTNLFPKPNVLEFETMKYPFWLHQKKNYAAMEYPGDQWKDVKPKLTIKGLPFKKRDRCRLVRRIGFKIMNYIMEFQSHLILEYLKTELNRLVLNQVPFSDLAITCLLKDESSYINENLIQLDTARKISARNGGLAFESGCRLSYVVIQGKQAFHQRGEDPVYAAEHNLKIDLLYYLDKQLLSAIEPLFQFHPNIDLSSLVRQIRQKLTRTSTGVVSLFSMAKKRKCI